MIFNGASEKIIQAIINGLVKVGNAAKLDGHEAEYFVDRGQSLRASILEKALEVGNGVYHFIFSGSNTPTDDLPSGTYRYGSATVIKRGEGSITVILWGSTNNSYAHFLPKFNYYNNGTWTGWKGLDDFLPLSNTSIPTVNTSHNNTFAINNTGESGSYCWQHFKLLGELLGAIGFDSKNKLLVSIPNVGIKDILHTGNMASHVLPLSGGGIVESTALSPLGIKNTGANAKTAIRYYNGDTLYGYLGFSAVNTPILIKADNTACDLIHTGNSAKTVISSTAPSDTTALWIDTSA